VDEATITRVVEVFEGVGAKWALVGAHAVGLLTTPRATADFDFIVEERKLRAVLDELGRVLGELDARDIGAAVRLFAIDVDLIRSTNHPLFKEALTRTERVGDWNVPRPEVLIVLKYLSAISPWRSAEKKAYDIGDLRSIYRAVGRERLDLGLMTRLSGLVYPGAERGFEALLERVDAGEPVEV
jgi:hypothetical protein